MRGKEIVSARKREGPVKEKILFRTEGKEKKEHFQKKESTKKNYDERPCRRKEKRGRGRAEHPKAPRCCRSKRVDDPSTEEEGGEGGKDGHARRNVAARGKKKVIKLGGGRASGLDQRKERPYT